MSIDSLERHAAWFQKCAADDARLAMLDTLDLDYRIDWQHFAADAAKAAREYLFELIDRKAGK